MVGDLADRMEEQMDELLMQNYEGGQHVMTMLKQEKAATVETSTMQR